MPSRKQQPPKDPLTPPSANLDGLDIDVAVGEGTRRFPVYLLLDTSGSMAGAPIEAVRRGVEQFAKEVSEDPFSLETVHVGVITFGGEAQLVTKGLVPAGEFHAPSLSATGQTPMGQALWLLLESIDRDLKKPVRGGEKGDWKPLVFLLTDGEPTDEWQQAVDEIRARHQRKLVNIITVGCGPHLNQDNLKRFFMGPTFNMDNDETSFRKFFQWVTETVKTVGKTVSQPGGGEAPATLPPPPGGMQYIP